MGNARIVEVEYHLLIEKIRQAADMHRLITKSDKEKWSQYVAENGVRETALFAFGRVKFASGKPQLVAIAMGDEWGGCYVYSKEDEAALKFVKGAG